MHLRPSGAVGPTGPVGSSRSGRRRGAAARATSYAVATLRPPGFIAGNITLTHLYITLNPLYITLSPPNLTLTTPEQPEQRRVLQPVIPPPAGG